LKHITFLYSDKTKYKQAMIENKTSYKSQLMQVFTSLEDKSKIQKVLDDLHKNFPYAKIIGATTAGAISHAKIYENETAISLSLFKKTDIYLSYEKNIDYKSGIKLFKDIEHKNIKAAIVLSEGLNGKDYEGFIRGFKDEKKELIVAGGLAGDNFKLKKTFVFKDNKIYKNGSVAVSFCGKKLSAQNKYNLNWTPIGKEFTITSATNNIVHTIDNESAVSLFKKYLGDKIFQNGAIFLPNFQLLYKNNPITVSRTPMKVIDNSIVFAGPVKEGEKVQFGFSNASSIVSGANNIWQELSQDVAEGIYIYSCIARKTLLGKVLEDEFILFEDIAPSSGFFTYGEYYSTGNDNALLNCTSTLLVLSEKSQKKKKIIKKVKSKSEIAENVTFSALTHFIEQTSLELNSNVKLLNQYKEVVDVSDLVSKTDKNGIITYVNDNFCKISQYTESELLGKNHNIVRDLDIPDFTFKKMWKAICSGKIWKGKLSNIAKDGSKYYIDTTIMPIYDKYNNISEFIAIRKDITKQVLNNKKIKDKEKFIKIIFDNQDNIVIYASKSKGMISANKKLFEYFDYSDFEDFKSKNKCICDLFIYEDGYIHPSKDENWLDNVAKNISADNKVKMLTKDKNIHTFNLKVKKVEDEYIINLSDITNLEKALLKAYSSEQAKSIFLANMSHEIRTPLNGILGFTDLLTKRDLDVDTHKYVDIINKSGQTLLNVVNDILDFSKIESGELELYKTESNLLAELEASVAIFASVAKNKHIHYYTYIDTDIPKALECDIQRIKQVINNLLSNAIKFTPENGTVEIHVDLKKIINNSAEINFSVKDSGIGIDKDKISTIFQAFSQADNSISRKFGGTGLGLAISSQYIKMMRSEIKVKSKKGKGSEFYFTLNFPVINASKGLEKDFDINHIHIDILERKNEIVCGVNEIVRTYLHRWNMKYNIIYSLDELSSSSDMLIVCDALFDVKKCTASLNRFSKLHLVYIESYENNFNCLHERFHRLEQPMTGSMLFDQIIFLLHKDAKFKQTNNTISNEVEKFSGNILVAEDNETNQMLITIMLEERGLDYTIVSNGQEAVNEASEKNFDLIFMDINMPVLDGVSATKLLRKNSYTFPIVSLSANVIDSDLLEFKKAGVDDTLSKPIIPKELDIILSRLSLSSIEITKKLLLTFKTSVEKILKDLEIKDLDKNILHNIKGMSGNLRFNELYNLAVEYEKNVEDWNEASNKANKALLVEHLKNLLEKIKTL